MFRPHRWTSGTWLGILVLFWIGRIQAFPNLFQSWGTTDPAVTCNKNTSFSCPCETCWTSSSPFPPSSEVQWVAVEFQKCPVLSEASEAAGRKHLAQWLTEECAFVLDCRFAVETFTSKNILIGGIECLEEGPKKHGTVYFAALKNSSENFATENIVPSSALGSVVQAREHLFSSLFQSDLDSVMIIEKRQIQKLDNPRIALSSTPMVLAILALVSLLLSFILTFGGICFCTLCWFSQIKWSRFASSKWIKGTNEPKPRRSKNADHELCSLQKTTKQCENGNHDSGSPLTH